MRSLVTHVKFKLTNGAYVCRALLLFTKSIVQIKEVKKLGYAL
jgi:hypothetical protein